MERYKRFRLRTLFALVFVVCCLAAMSRWARVVIPVFWQQMTVLAVPAVCVAACGAIRLKSISVLLCGVVTIPIVTCFLPLPTGGWSPGCRWGTIVSFNACAIVLGTVAAAFLGAGCCASVVDSPHDKARYKAALARLRRTNSEAHRDDRRRPTSG
jgi:hypothetical protein